MESSRSGADVRLDVFFEDDVLVCAGACDNDVGGFYFISDVLEGNGDGVHVVCEAFGAGAGSAGDAHAGHSGAHEGGGSDASGFAGADQQSGFSGEVADFAFEKLDAERWYGDLGPSNAGFFAGFASGPECYVEHAREDGVGRFVDVCECLKGPGDLPGYLVVALH